MAPRPKKTKTRDANLCEGSTPQASPHEASESSPSTSLLQTQRMRAQSAFHDAPYSNTSSPSSSGVHSRRSTRIEKGMVEAFEGKLIQNLQHM
jgi:hypothetical protein